MFQEHGLQLAALDYLDPAVAGCEVHSSLQAQIAFPIRRRPDADTCTVPMKRRKLRPVRPAGRPSITPFKPEPAIADSDYQAALAVLRNSRNALERTPSLAEELDEESSFIRSKDVTAALADPRQSYRRVSARAGRDCLPR